jgi:hypothetical protein
LNVVVPTERKESLSEKYFHRARSIKKKKKRKKMKKKKGKERKRKEKERKGKKTVASDS